MIEREPGPAENLLLPVVRCDFPVKVHVLKISINIVVLICFSCEQCPFVLPFDKVIRSQHIEFVRQLFPAGIRIVIDAYFSFFSFFSCNNNDSVCAT